VVMIVRMPVRVGMAVRGSLCRFGHRNTSSGPKLDEAFSLLRFGARD
jgi:hypothetical protein